MKIFRLDLSAFGPFSDKSLDLSGGDHGFHLIYGPNEAGKSSALRALTQLLYGIPMRSPDDFIHPYSQMRIGGCLSANGQVLEIIRRKGREKTLRAGDDWTPVPESELKQLLAGIDADRFRTMFGIDHAALVKGGEEIIAGGGRAGQILFSAGAGIADLRQIQSELEEKAQALFKPSGQKPRLNAAFRDLKETRQAIQAAQLSGGEWARHQQALDQALKQRETLSEGLSQKQREKNQLERIQEALPAIARRDALLEQLAGFEEIPRLPQDFGERRQTLQYELRLAQGEAERGENRLAQIQTELAGLAVPDHLIAKAKLIESLNQELGSHLKAAQDRSRVEGLRSSARAEARHILAGLRPDLDLKDAESLRLKKAQIVWIRELGSEYERLNTRQETDDAEQEKLKARVEKLKAELARVRKPPDTGPLQTALNAARKSGDLEAMYAARQKELQAAVKKAELGFKKLGRWQGELSALAALAVPPPETVDEYEDRLATAWEEQKALEKDFEAISQRLLEMESGLSRMQKQGEVPTESDLQAARDKRDQGWSLVKSAWRTGQAPEPHAFMAAFAPGDLAGAYEASVRQADNLADRLRRESDRVAKKSQLLAEQEKALQQKEAIGKKLDQARQAFSELNAQWEALWEPLGIPPASPREMRAWLNKQAALAEQCFRIEQERARMEELTDQIKSLRQSLLRTLGDLGELVDANAPLGRLTEDGTEFAKKWEKEKNRQERLQADMAEREEELQAVRARVRKREAAQVQWQKQWAEAIRPLGLSPEATPEQAEAVLDDLNRLFEKLNESVGYDKRMAGIDRDAADFARKVRELVAQEAPDLTEFEPENAVAELQARLTRAVKLDQSRGQLKKDEKREQKAVQTARERIARVDDQLVALCDEAGTEPLKTREKTLNHLAHVEQRAARRDGLADELAQLEKGLNKLSAGQKIADFIDQARAVDPDGIASALSDLSERIGELEAERNAVIETIGRERNELARMDGGAKAARLAETAQEILAQIQADAEEYIRLKLATGILQQAVERYREKNQGPVLQKANGLFSRITQNAFDSLRPEFDEKGTPVLVGVRFREGKEELVTADGMSEGTADQLYLALRLASLEHYLERNEPFPFVLDDILIKFDDERAGATLSALAELSARTQVIFFTHHRHLIDLARQRIPATELFVHAL